MTLEFSRANCLRAASSAPPIVSNLLLTASTPSLVPAPSASARGPTWAFWAATSSFDAPASLALAVR